MITQEEADTASVFHDPRTRSCNSPQGPFRWRRNGATQRWKRDTERFRIPVKFGMYTHAQFTNGSRDVEAMHTGADCPVAPEGHN